MAETGAQSKSKTDAMPLMEYKMNNKRRGTALIFNQKNFQQYPKPRLGTDKDRENLKERFLALGFEVTAHDDKNKEEIFRELRKAAKKTHTDADCFVCIFLTHGKEGEISASDQMINIKEITDLFRGDQCRSLVGKPKIFIFQACAGEQHESGVTGMSGGASDAEAVDEPDMVYIIPAGADFILCYSTVEGFVSYRNTDSGTFYIQELCEALQNHASTLEFTEILTLVNMKLSQQNLGNGWIPKKQMPCFTSMLTKKLYFRSNTQQQ